MVGLKKSAAAGISSSISNVFFLKTLPFESQSMT